jgi:hypothetical protein
MLRRGGFVAVALALASCANVHDSAPGGGAAARFADYAPSPPLLRAFLYRMPKGGDLHNHLSGAAYAEASIRAGAAAGNCVDFATAKVSPPPCAKPARPLADAVTDAALNKALVDAWSMRDFVPTSGFSGHDQFFAAFAKFGGAAPQPDMAAEVVDRAGRQRMRYVELMITFQGNAVGALADQVAKTAPWTGDAAAFEAALMQAGLAAIVEKARRDVDALEQGLRARLQCDTSSAGPGCGVTVRWLQQVSRTAPPHRVFAASLFGMLLARAEPRVVGIDFVAPEDNPVALADYTAQMRMLDYLYGRMLEAKISLHAGELTMGAVRPEDLLFHIRQAVELGHARRIGHGVDVMYETDAFGLLREMAERRVAVEVNLTSNAQILGVSGATHPFMTYLKAGVPVVLSTDDEGIERVDRTHELERAVETYGLSWEQLVALERNTLEYAFVDGASLWADARTWRRVTACDGLDAAAEPSEACATFLKASTKARLQWALERELSLFDREATEMRLAEKS